MYRLFLKLISFFILIFGFLSFNDSFLHPLHVSNTEITVNSKQKSIEIECKVFTDDFENALRKQNKTKIDLSAPDLHKEMDAVVKKYIENHLQIKINDKKQVQNYIGFEIDREAVHVFLEMEAVKSFDKINIDNRILCDYFEDQMNIVHVILFGKRKSASLNNPNTQLEFKF